MDGILHRASSVKILGTLESQLMVSSVSRSRILFKRFLCLAMTQ